MTTYYVSSEIGSNNNAGTSQNAPLASLQAAANVVKPGDTVQVMNGTYAAPFYADALDITTSGTANAPITFEAAPGRRLSSTVLVGGMPLISRRADSRLPALLGETNTLAKRIGNRSMFGTDWCRTNRSGPHLLSWPDTARRPFA